MQVDDSINESAAMQQAANGLQEKTRRYTALIDELSDEMQGISNLFSDIRNSNSLIVSNVNTISTANERVSNSTHEAGVISENNIRLLNEFTELMDSLMKEIDALKGMI